MPDLWKEYESLAQFSLPNLYERLSVFVLVNCFDIRDKLIISKMQKAMEVFVTKISNQIELVNLRLFDEVARTVEFCDTNEKSIIFESVLVSLLYVGIVKKVLPIFPFQFYDDVDSFCKVYVENGYSQFSSLDISEKKELLCYANFMKIVVYLWEKPVGKRAHFMKIITGLCEGKDTKYITGSGMSKATLCRVQIYQQEANVLPSPRPLRRTEIAKFLLECDIFDVEAPEAIRTFYSGAFPNQKITLNNRSFDHPSVAGVTVDAMEVTANGVHMIKTISYSRASHDKETSHEISTSIQCVLLSDEDDLSTVSGFKLVSSKNLDHDEGYDELEPAKVVTMTRQSFHEEDNQIRAWLEREENYWMNDSSWMHNTSMTDCTFNINSSTLKNVKMQSISTNDYHDARRTEDAENRNLLEFSDTSVDASTAAIERNGNNLLSRSQPNKRKYEISAPQFVGDGPPKVVKRSFDLSS